MADNYNLVLNGTCVKIYDYLRRMEDSTAIDDFINDMALIHNRELTVNYLQLKLKTVKSSYESYKADLLVKVAEIVTNKALKKMRSFNNPSATAILNDRYRFDTVYDDLKQDVMLHLLETGTEVHLIETETGRSYADMHNMEKTQKVTIYKPVFKTDKEKLNCYKVVEKSLYRMATKEYKRLFIEVETMDENGNYVIDSIMYTKAVKEQLIAESDIECRNMVEDLKKDLTDKQWQILQLKMEGYKQSEIATICQITAHAVAKHEDAIKRKFVNYCHDGDTEAYYNHLMENSQNKKKNTTKSDSWKISE